MRNHSVLGLLATAVLLAVAPLSALGQDDDPELVWAPLVTPPPLVDAPVASPAELGDGFALGSPDAPVTVEVWEDFQCPFCQRFTFEVEPDIVEQYVLDGQVRLVFRNLAFLGDESHWAAVAGSLAADQDMFWPMHDLLFANFRGKESGGYHIDRLLEMADRSGLDMAEFREGLRLDNARARFAEIQAEGLRDAGARGINATPTVVVNGVPLQSPDFATVAAAIDVALSQLESPAESTEGEGVDAPEETPSDG